eukprot:GHVH01009226.1.p1 GENE.GHVH01009226.1~~GHVH01009226.1.p1  ORF type:complete len:389 (-),score=35.51 GHVH01009226.1:1386-2552(-)
MVATACGVPPLERKNARPTSEYSAYFATQFLKILHQKVSTGTCGFVYGSQTVDNESISVIPTFHERIAILPSPLPHDHRGCSVRPDMAHFGLRILRQSLSCYSMPTNMKCIGGLCCCSAAKSPPSSPEFFTPTTPQNAQGTDEENAQDSDVDPVSEDVTPWLRFWSNDEGELRMHIDGCNRQWSSLTVWILPVSNFSDALYLSSALLSFQCGQLLPQQIVTNQNNVKADYGWVAYTDNSSSKKSSLQRLLIDMVWWTQNEQSYEALCHPPKTGSVWLAREFSLFHRGLVKIMNFITPCSYLLMFNERTVAARSLIDSVYTWLSEYLGYELYANNKHRRMTSNSLTYLYLKKKLELSETFSTVVLTKVGFMFNQNCPCVSLCLFCRGRG